MKEKENYRLNEIAKRYDVSLRTVERWVKTGELPSFKIGNTRFVPTKALEQKECQPAPIATNSPAK